MFATACSNNTSTTLNAVNLEQILAVDKPSVIFSSQRNAPVPVAQLVSARYFGDALQVFPVGELPAWMSLEINENPTKKLTLLQINVKDTQLEAGQYKAQVRLVVYRKTAFSYKPLGSKLVNVRYHLMDHFAASLNAIQFHDVFGNKQTLSKSFKIYGTGSDWQADTDQPWLNVNRRHGMGNAQLEVSVDATNKLLRQGEQIAHVSLSDRFSGRKLNIPVTVRLEPPRLLVSQYGIAFTQLYRKRKVEQTVQVYSNTQQPIPWYAYATQPWLKVKQASDGRTLSVSANPKRLKVGMHYATVVVKAKKKTKNVERIRVGFYVNGNVRHIKPTVQLSEPHKQNDMVSDPIRPYVYITAGSSIHRYNIYTGEQQTIEDLGKELTGLTVSSDGQFLYMADAANYSIRIYDLRDDAMSQIWHGPFFESSSERPHLQLSYARINGHPVLINNSFYAFDANNGNKLGRFKAVTKPGQECCKNNLPYIGMSRDGSSLYALERAENTHELYHFALQYSHIKGVGLIVKQTGYIVEDGLALDLAVSPDGAEACTVTTGVTMFQCYYGESVTPSRSIQLNAQPNNIEFGGLGDIYTAGVMGGGKRPTIWRFDALSGKKDHRFKLGGEVNERQMLISSDDLSIITLSHENRSLSFLSAR